MRAKLQETCEAEQTEERIEKRRNHFKKLLRKPPKIKETIVKKIIEQKLSNDKACGLDNSPSKVCIQRRITLFLQSSIQSTTYKTMG